MTRKTYHKLIRDRIPEIITKNGGKPEVSVLNEADFEKALRAKMVEEAKEIAVARSRQEVTNELSDIEELVRAIAKNNRISNQEIKQHRAKKLKERGGFVKRLFLEFVEEE